jgi:hypothetical protein
MEVLSTILIIYGILCVLIGLLKPPFIWKMKKFEVMAKMFGGDLGLTIFVLVWGAIAITVGVIL